MIEHIISPLDRIVRFRESKVQIFYVWDPWVLFHPLESTRREWEKCSVSSLMKCTIDQIYLNKLPLDFSFNIILTVKPREVQTKIK